jgi:hypothetical protein
MERTGSEQFVHNDQFTVIPLENPRESTDDLLSFG